MKKKVEVSLLGQTFTVKSDRDEAYIHGLANYVGRRIEEVRRQTRAVSTHNVALLVALNLADELFQAEEDAAELREGVRARTTKLIDALKAASAAAETREPAPAKESLVLATATAQASLPN